MTLRSGLMLGLLALSSSPMISSGAEMTSTTTGTSRAYTETESTYIRSLNCDTFAEVAARARCLDIKNVALSQSTGTSPSPTQTKPTPGSDMEMKHPIRQGEKPNEEPKPKNPMRSDAEMSHPLEGIAMAIAQLSPTDRETLVKMIREYLTSKGVDLTKYAEKREEIRDIKKETRDDTKEIKKESKTEIIAIRTKAQESLRIKREEMRAKIKALGANTEVKK